MAVIFDSNRVPADARRQVMVDRTTAERWRQAVLAAVQSGNALPPVRTYQQDTDAPTLFWAPG